VSIRNPLALSLALLAVLSVKGQAPVAQPASNPPPPVQLAAPMANPPLQKDPATSVLEFQRFLSERAKEHQQFLEESAKRTQEDLEKWWGRTWAALLALLGVGGTILAFLNWKSKKDIEETVKAKFEQITGESIQQHLESFKEQLSRHIANAEDFQRQMPEFIAAIGHAALILSLEDAEGQTGSIPKEQEAKKELRKRSCYDALERLKRFTEPFPTHRTLGIFIGRLYAAVGDPFKAAEVLKEVIKARELAKLEEDEDLAALLYNRACYLTIHSRNITVSVEKDSLSKEARKCLRRACKLTASNIEEGLKDDDLKEWRDELSRMQNPPEPIRAV
jgi:tetratricopeptide (TPR) repeat protein